MLVFVFLASEYVQLCRLYASSAASRARMHHKQRLLFKINRLWWLRSWVLDAVASDHGNFLVSLHDQVWELFLSHLRVSEQRIYFAWQVLDFYKPGRLLIRVLINP